MPPNRSASSAIHSTLNELLRVFLVADGLDHWAGKSESRTKPQSKFAPTYFVYAFFAFNSVYSVGDWNAADRAGVPEHPNMANGNRRSEKQQIRLLCQSVFAAAGCSDHAAGAVGFSVDRFRTALSNRLARLTHVTEDAGGNAWSDWLTGIRESENGDRTSLRTNQIRAAREIWTALGPASEKLPSCEKIADLVEFVYLVRCRMFHGDKPLDELKVAGQQRRLVAYTAILLTVLELFFEQATERFGWTKGVYN